MVNLKRLIIALIIGIGIVSLSMAILHLWGTKLPSPFVFFLIYFNLIIIFLISLSLSFAIIFGLFFPLKVFFNVKLIYILTFSLGVYAAIGIFQRLIFDPNYYSKPHANLVFKIIIDGLLWPFITVLGFLGWFK